MAIGLWACTGERGEAHFRARRSDRPAPFSAPRSGAAQLPLRPWWPGRSPVGDAQSLQRLMFAEAIGRPLPITVFRNAVLVDVIAEPVELKTV